MSPRRCYVPNCTVTQKDDVPLHRFPNPTKLGEIERFRTWVLNVGGDIVGEDNLSIFIKRRVCHRHFEEIYTYPNHRLTSLAIPTLHLSGVHVTQPTVAGQAPVPVASTSTASQSATVIRHGLPQVHRFLNKNAIPSVFSWSKTASSDAVAREQRYLQLTSKRELVSITSKQIEEKSVEYPVNFQELNESDSHVPEEQAYVTVENDDTTEEVAHAEERGVNDKHNSNTDNSANTVPKVKTSVKKKSRHDIDDIKIDYDNIDKFGEQIAFLLKRVPRKLCRELQDSIVTLVKTAARNNYGSKTNINVPASASSCTKQLKTNSRNYGSNTRRDVTANTSFTKQIKGIISATEHDHGRLTKKYVTESSSSFIKQIKTNISTAAQNYKSINKRNTTTNYITKQIKTPISATTGNCDNITNVTALKAETVPIPMPLPMELVEEMDCIKQEILDPEEANDKAIHEDITTNLMFTDPLETEIDLYDTF